ncbi:hypothetical protein FOS14_23330 [Skermania sp. ID1734]|uniref:hypothetical protein n=1 Tax=Skermania sp. ID1734 TaxID=2597516 RepID=UPI00118141DB|nr:hypothetical protein [Skermania sp. ID1734]TSD93353.1 hypothetical protein FOS14_23330 [Skermania sp. ID1734]
MTVPHRRRPALIALVIVAALGCLALGWWQWNRFESASGTFQNLGYALQWPLFAVAVVYAYRRFVQLEDGTAPVQNRKKQPREVPADLLPQRPTAQPQEVDQQMREYNKYLAELNARERDRSNS